MPNYCFNQVSMNGIKNKDLYNKEGEFDFNKIIPMPDSLDMDAGSATDDGIDMIMMEILKYWIESPSYRIPVANMLAVKELYSEISQHLNRYLCSAIASTEDINKCKMLGMQALYNVAMHGFPTWYEWCTTVWGTKWNAFDTFINDDDHISFTTAWQIPYGIFMQLSSMYPYDEIIVNWEEEGGCCGTTSFLDGECIQDDQYVIQEWYDEEHPKLFSKLKRLED